MDQCALTSALISALATSGVTSASAGASLTPAQIGTCLTPDAIGTGHIPHPQSPLVSLSPGPSLPIVPSAQVPPH